MNSPKVIEYFKNESPRVSNFSMSNCSPAPRRVTASNISLISILRFSYFEPNVQVNLFQKLSFLNQLTHNITRDCWLNSPKNTSSQFVVFFYLLYTNIVLNVKTKTKKQYLYTTCCELLFFGEFNEQSLVILWVKAYKIWKNLRWTFDKSVVFFARNNVLVKKSTKIFSKHMWSSRIICTNFTWCKKEGFWKIFTCNQSIKWNFWLVQQRIG